MEIKKPPGMGSSKVLRKAVLIALPVLLSLLFCLIAVQVWLPSGKATLQWELRALSVLLSLPGFALCHWTGVGFFTPLGQLLAAPFSGLIYWLCRRRVEPAPPPGYRELAPACSGTSGGRRLLSRRGFLQGTLGAGACLALGGYGTGERWRLEVTRRKLALAGLPTELEGLRVVLLADMHCGRNNSVAFLSRVADAVNELEPDLILIPGDFVEGVGGSFAGASRVLARLRPRLATLGTLGNHDHWEGVEHGGGRLLEEAGLRLLDNTRLLLTPDRRLVEHGSQGLVLAGVGDLWAGRVDLEAALGGLSESLPRLLLSHNPDVAEDHPTLHRVDLMLSGHTHGGQVRLPGIGAPAVPSRYGEKYASGWVQGPSYPVFITRGVGSTGIPIRVGSPPELVLFELVSA